MEVHFGVLSIQRCYQMAELKRRIAQTAVDACEESLRVAGETRASLNDVEERNKNVEKRCLKNK